ncbi:hypothetical protein E1A91_A12G198500v1 [Gossypium mustelinum]|uniref:Pentacotripeptide-repeat region of PRORP domain-containing protein n=1 Tax=Gossypium mustelinum TaxID=34275 RepID=A0A5D2WW67_GOSMU|nr:hypothetical protein E1A91_A12G198500v1 [Gossypium mustelinum]
MPPLTSLQLRRLLHRCFSSPSPFQPHALLSPKPQFTPTHFPKLPFVISKPFSTQNPNPQTPDSVALSLSAELLKDPSLDPLTITPRLQLHFSHIKPTPLLISQTLNLSPEAGRTVLGFNDWVLSDPDFNHTDETLSFFIDYFGRRKDFKAAHDLLVNHKSVAGPKTLNSSIDRLARAGRPTQVLGFFERMEKDYGFKRNKESLKLVVEKLCENGYASYAEKLVKDSANEIFPDEMICDLLIKGWCVDGKLEEARRLAGEMYRGGFEIGTMAYNAMLDCICKLCREKDPFRLHSEAEKVLLDMDFNGVPRNAETFNLLLNNLCKIRKTEDAVKLLFRMGEWGCYPNAESYLILIRSLYQAARIGEGDEMIDGMKSAGFGDQLGKKEYYGFLKILCGIERVEHAMSVFKKMKADGCKPGIKTYDLLMGKWCAHNRLDRANALYNEALKNGVPVEPRPYRVDPRYMKKTKAVKKKKKRETFSEKLARKRRRLKQIRLSFVKKSKGRMRSA